MGEINVLAAARTRLLDQEKSTLAGALTNQPDDSIVISLIEDAYTRRGQTGQPLDAIELEIAERLDAGVDYPLGNEQAFQGVLWLAQTDPVNLPSPMPRDFALYFAIAWKSQGRYATVAEGLQFIYDNIQMSEGVTN